MTVTPTAATEPLADGAQRRRDEVAIDVAVDDHRRVLAFERRRQAQHRERKARVALRGDRRVDEQNTCAGMISCGGVRANRGRFDWRTFIDSCAFDVSLNIVNLSLTKSALGEHRDLEALRREIPRERTAHRRRSTAAPARMPPGFR